MTNTDSGLNLSRRLFKSRSDRMIAGVCGGTAHYFNVDTGAVRIIWAASIIFGGAGLVAYVIALLIIPEEPVSEAVLDLEDEISDVSRLINEHFEDAPEKPVRKNRFMNKGLFWGILLTFFGVYFLLIKTGLIPFSIFFWNFPWELIIPVAMIITGVWLIIKKPGALRGADLGLSEPAGDFRRSIEGNKLLLGVCGGIAGYFNIDVSIVRIAWILLTLFTIPIGILIYLLLAFLVPDQNDEKLVDTEGLKRFDF